MKKGLLEGIRIADFCWALAGPRSTKILADHGAEVIKIEGRNKRIDNQRVTAPFKDDVPGVDRGAIFNPYNTGKLSIALDLADPRGVETAKRVVAQADVVTENFAGGTMQRMGLGYEDLKKVNPDIIMLSSSMQGQSGPHSRLPGFGGHLVALAGIRQIAGWPDRMPAEMEVYTDFIVSHFAVPTILAALLYRNRTGRGQYIDMAQYESAVHFIAPLILDNEVNGRSPERMGNRLAYAAPHGAYRCLGDDRWCAIAAFTDEEWDSFAKVIGDPGWTRDPRFSTLLARKDNEDELDRLVERWTVTQGAEEVMRSLQAAGVAAGVVQTVEDLMEFDPQLEHRHFYWKLPHPDVGTYVSPGPSFSLSRTPCELRRAPLLGEHNHHVLKEIVHMSDDEIADLVLEGILE